LKVAIKPINNPNGVFSGVIRYNWWSEVVKDPNIVQYVCGGVIYERFF
jgi:hypothetical protein